MNAVTTAVTADHEGGELVMSPSFISNTSRNSRGQMRAHFRCQCGVVFEALKYNVTSGHTKSCGCLKVALGRAARLTHDESRPQSIEYRTWATMKTRCLNPANKSYPSYGGRGVRICQEWIDSYTAFLAHVGRRPSPKHSLDRIDNQGHYEPGNVRWATASEQARNTRANRIIEFRGQRQCLEAWADELGISQSTLFERLEKWPLDRALTTPNTRRA